MNELVGAIAACERLAVGGGACESHAVREGQLHGAIRHFEISNGVVWLGKVCGGIGRNGRIRSNGCLRIALCLDDDHTGFSHGENVGEEPVPGTS